jgi:hypothetical protein
MLAGAGVLVAWELRQHVDQREQLALVAQQLQTQQRELEARRPELEALEQRNLQLEEAERRAGNQTLLALMRERAACSQSSRELAQQKRGIGGALANVLDNPQQWDAEREHLSNQIRAGMGTFFRLAKLSPERVNQYIDFSVEAERRKSARLSALLHGTMPVAEAIRERDEDDVEFEKKRHEVLGDEGYAFYNGIADGMITDEAKRLLKLIQQNMGGNELSQEQSERLQPLIKSEIVPIKMDDVELFRPPEEWAQGCVQRQENVARSAAEFLTPAQLETLRAIGAYDLADRQKQMAARRESLGIK